MEINFNCLRSFYSCFFRNSFCCTGDLPTQSERRDSTIKYAHHPLAIAARYFYYWAKKLGLTATVTIFETRTNYISIEQ
jgi:hypothetical protein